MLLAAGTSVAGFGLLDRFELEAARPCQTVCPCEDENVPAPLDVETCQTTTCSDTDCDDDTTLAEAETLGFLVVTSVAHRPVLEQDPAEPPCSSDCPDCHCSTGVATAYLPTAPFAKPMGPIVATLPELPAGLTEGMLAELFRPPRPELTPNS